MPKTRGIPRPQEMKIVVNEDKPQTTALLLEFEPDLSLTKEGWWPSQILVDDSENIYVAQDNESTIFKFDSFGNEVLAKNFQRDRVREFPFRYRIYFLARRGLHSSFKLWTKKAYRLPISHTFM